jgi:hypothetical protein
VNLIEKRILNNEFDEQNTTQKNSLKPPLTICSSQLLLEVAILAVETLLLPTGTCAVIAI